MSTFDYIIVGSGCSGAIAAQTLVDSGARVAMLDVGTTDGGQAAQVPGRSFADIRQNEDDQYKYLVGGRGEGITWGRISKGAQLTPPRMHINKLIDRLIPLESSTFQPLESLGYGGLGIGWGLQCWTFSPADLRKTALPKTAMADAYDQVSRMIGISATDDDAAPYTIGGLRTYQPSPRTDRNHTYILQKYAGKRNRLLKKGVHVGRTPLALITEDLGHRKAYSYADMDFYTNEGLSAWRPWVTIDELRKKQNFTYIPSRLVTRFQESASTATVTVLDTGTNKASTYTCRKLILASGALGTARIVLRSLGSPGRRLPLLSNPHAYIPCLQPAMAGKGTEPRKLSLGQVSYFIDPDGDDSGLSVASSYSYQSLMLFRIIKEVPLDFADARALMQYLSTGMVIMIAQHPDEKSADKYVELASDPSSPTGDKLLARYQLGDRTERQWDEREKAYSRLMRQFNTFPLKRVHPPHGSAIHYAGTLPFSKDQKEFGLSPEGLLHGTRNVFVADSSGFQYLPAKGLTLSLMANAYLTARNILADGK